MQLDVSHETESFNVCLYPVTWVVGGREERPNVVDPLPHFFHPGAKGQQVVDPLFIWLN